VNEIFKSRVESPQEPEIAPQAPQPLKSDELTGLEKKAQEPSTKEEERLEIWEGLHSRKFVTEYFDIGNIDGEFNLKMDTSVIDKYIKSELETRKYDKNIDNWKSILAEIEKEIGSDRMETFSRIKKIVGYIKVVQKINEFKKKKELYKSFLGDS
jgi:hypothetical protein